MVLSLCVSGGVALTTEGNSEVVEITTLETDRDISVSIQMHITVNQPRNVSVYLQDGPRYDTIDNLDLIYQETHVESDTIVVSRGVQMDENTILTGEVHVEETGEVVRFSHQVTQDDLNSSSQLGRAGLGLGGLGDVINRDLIAIGIGLFLLLLIGGSTGRIRRDEEIEYR